MSEFPRTMVGGVSMPRLICGSNWFLGYSHTSRAKDRLIKELFDTPAKMARVVEVFARRGCNAFMSMQSQFVAEALREVEQRVGVPMLWVTTPAYKEPGNPDTWKASVDEARELGATFCFPHQCVTDPRIDRVNRCLSPQLIEHLAYVREAGMVPGLSSHAPEAITCSDACGADVETYITPYNAAGFLCQVETDWIQRIIHSAKKPVMTIKPLAAGRLLPPTGLSFVWSTLRDCDLVTIGTMSTYEAEEVIEISLACLEQRKAEVELQYTRSKSTLVG
ncbi:MAG: hypothetical protein GX785_11590 [Armatimonadetes bacterium]|nr:hypothetical protein [Armatimonadota bacterium]HPO72841.1 hypothetical protein [Armatimonadota bacterium]